MKTFVINLDRNPERLVSVKRQLDALGVAFERFPAVDGRALSPAERRAKFDAGRSLKAMRRRMSDGEIGCALSHLGVYLRMEREESPCALVLEDDIEIDRRFLPSVDRAMKAMDPARPQVYLFSALNVEGAAERAEEIVEEEAMWCADGYLVNLAAARLILTENLPVIRVADAFRQWHRYHGLELFHVFPSTVRQRDDAFGSNIAIPAKPNLLIRNLYWLRDCFERRRKCPVGEKGYASCRKVSVIVPVYNVERYLKRCIDSVVTAAERVVATGRHEVEIVCVNDGSTDGSGAVLDDYSRAFAARGAGVSFRVVTKKNEGLGEARNSGISVATGDYVLFVDSDDYIPSYGISAFVEIVERTGSALVISSSIDKRRGVTIDATVRDEPSVRIGWTSRTREWISGRRVQYCAWNKFYSRGLLENRPFPRGVFEDFSWTTSVLCDVESFVETATPLYVYCQNSGSSSITRSAYSDRKTVDSFAAIGRVLDYGRGTKAWEFALRQAVDGLSSTIGQVFRARRTASLPLFREELEKLNRRHPEAVRRISLKARYRLSLLMGK